MSGAGGAKDAGLWFDKALLSEAEGFTTNGINPYRSSSTAWMQEVGQRMEQLPRACRRTYPKIPIIHR